MTSKTTLLLIEKMCPNPPDGDGGYGIQRRPGESDRRGGKHRQVDATILSRNGAHGPAATGAYVRRVFRNEVVFRVGGERGGRMFCRMYSPALVVMMRKFGM